MVGDPSLGHNHPVAARSEELGRAYDNLNSTLVASELSLSSSFYRNVYLIMCNFNYYSKSYISYATFTVLIVKLNLLC